MTGPFRGLVWETEQSGQAGEAGHQEGRLKRPAAYALLMFPMLVLGLNWPILVVTLESITPIWMAAIRVGGAALAMGAINAVRGNLVVPPRRDFPMILTVGVFRLAAIMVLVFFALQLVPAGRASVLVWTASLWTVPIAAVFLHERMTSRRWVGLVIGVSGVFVLSEMWGNNWRQRDVLVGTGLLLLGAMINAATSVYVRGHRWTVNPLQAVPWQMATATVPLVAGALIVDGLPNITWTAQLTWMMLYQSVLASGLAFWAQIVVLRNLSAVSTNLTMMGVPVIGVVSSAVFIGERITLSLALGMALVIVGVVINLLSNQANTKRVQ